MYQIAICKMEDRNAGYSFLAKREKMCNVSSENFVWHYYFCWNRVIRIYQIIQKSCSYIMQYFNSCLCINGKVQSIMMRMYLEKTRSQFCDGLLIEVFVPSVWRVCKHALDMHQTVIRHLLDRFIELPVKNFSVVNKGSL